MFSLIKDRFAEQKHRKLYEACLKRDLVSIRALTNQGADPKHILDADTVKKLHSKNRNPNIFGRFNDHDFDIDFNEPEIAVPHFEVINQMQFQPAQLRPRKYSNSCLEYAIETKDYDLFATLLTKTSRPVGNYLYQLMKLSIDNATHDITTALIELGGFSVLDGKMLRSALRNESLPVLEKLFSLGEDCSALLNLVLEFSIEKRSVSLLKFFRQNHLTVSPTNKDWEKIVLTGSAEFLREIIIHTKPSRELSASLIEAAIDSRQLECLSALVGAGLGEHNDFKRFLFQARKSGSIKTFLEIAQGITQGQTLPKEDWSAHIEKVLGHTLVQMKGEKLNYKDLFNFDKFDSFRDLPFTRIALRAAYLATIAAEQEQAVARAIMSEMLRQDLQRIGKTTGLSWAKYASSIDQEAVLPDHLPDLFRDITDALLLPVWSVDNLTKGLPESTLSAKRKELEQFAGVLYFEGKDTLTITLLSRRWLRHVDRIVAEYRPAKAGLEWIPLFNPIELDSGMKIVCLNTTAQLVEEGKALKHCVGSGGYATGCAEGRRHIISIRDPQNQSVATIDLMMGQKRDVISLGRLGDASVMQFFGMLNGEPPITAKNAWSEFKKLLSEGKVELSKTIGATEETKKLLKDQRFIKLFGFSPDDAESVLPAMYDRYAQISHTSKSGYDSQFFSAAVRTNILGRFSKLSSNSR